MKQTGGEGGSRGRCAFAQRGLAASTVVARLVVGFVTIVDKDLGLRLARY